MKLFKKDIFNYLILLIVPIISFADFDNSNPQISTIFTRGPVLVYDCNGQNTVCTTVRSYELCSDFNPKNRPCRLIKSFESQQKCIDFQLDIVSNNYEGHFCN